MQVPHRLRGIVAAPHRLQHPYRRRVQRDIRHIRRNPRRQRFCPCENRPNGRGFFPHLRVRRNRFGYRVRQFRIRNFCRRRRQRALCVFLRHPHPLAQSRQTRRRRQKPRHHRPNARRLFAQRAVSRNLFGQGCWQGSVRYNRVSRRLCRLRLIPRRLVNPPRRMRRVAACPVIMDGSHKSECHPVGVLQIRVRPVQPLLQIRLYPSRHIFQREKHLRARRRGRRQA